MTSRPASSAASVLAGNERRDPVQPGRADAEELERRRHRVGGELAAAGAGAGTGDVLELVQLRAGHPPDGVRPDRLEDVLDGHVSPAEAARRDRAVVENEPGEVEACERHHGRRNRLVAADQADEAVEQVAAGDELDRVGDHLARDERGAHSLGSHRDAVRDRDRVELHRRPAGRADARLHVLRQLALVEVARHRLDPGRGDADERPREVVVGEPDPLQHRARRGALGAVGERGAAPLGRVGRAVVRVGAHETSSAPFARGREPEHLDVGETVGELDRALLGVVRVCPDDHGRARSRRWSRRGLQRGARRAPRRESARALPGTARGGGRREPPRRPPRTERREPAPRSAARPTEKTASPNGTSSGSAARASAVATVVSGTSAIGTAGTLSATR